MKKNGEHSVYVVMWQSEHGKGWRFCKPLSERTSMPSDEGTFHTVKTHAGYEKTAQESRAHNRGEKKVFKIFEFKGET